MLGLDKKPTCKKKFEQLRKKLLRNLEMNKQAHLELCRAIKADIKQKQLCDVTKFAKIKF